MNQSHQAAQYGLRPTLRLRLSPADAYIRRAEKHGLVNSVAEAAPGTRYQFERLGDFCVDPDSAPGKPGYNRTVTLRDTWAKIEKRGGTRNVVLSDFNASPAAAGEEETASSPPCGRPDQRLLSAMARRRAMSRISSLVMS